MTLTAMSAIALRPAFPLAAPGLPRLEKNWVTLGGCGAGAVLACALLGPAHGLPGGAMAAAVFLASLAASLAGGVAFSALCGIVLFHIDVEPVRAVQVMMVCSLANQAAITWRNRRHVRWRELGPFLAGGALGIPPGLWLLLHADHHIFMQALGAILLAYSGIMLARATKSARAAQPSAAHWQHPCLDLLAGAMGGITGVAGAFPSAPVTIWCGLKGWDKGRQMAISQPFILLMQLACLIAVSLAARASHGGLAPGLVPSDLLCVPVGLLGTALGSALCQRISTRQFALALNLLLSVAGISFMI